jgi:hypothetical protein
MIYEDYINKLKLLEKEYDYKKSNLAKEFAFSNNLYKEGDIITDHIKTIKIEQIRYTKNGMNNKPECVYDGPELKKDKTTKKERNIGKELQGRIFQSNIQK